MPSLKILIVRHAQAERKEGLEISRDNDCHRALTKKSLKRFQKACNGIQYLVKDLDFIFSSEYLRSRQTADILSRQYHIQYQQSDRLNPDIPVERILDVLTSIDEEKVVALVGHNPSISQLIDYLVCGECYNLISLKKGSVCLVDYEFGQGKILWSLTQSQLESLSVPTPSECRL